MPDSEPTTVISVYLSHVLPQIREYPAGGLGSDFAISEQSLIAPGGVSKRTVEPSARVHTHVTHSWVVAS